jgi:ATP-binding protein involved in chromosome partitioning
MRERLHNDVLSAVSEVPGISSVELEFGVMNETQRDNVKKLLRGGREKFIPFAQPDSLTRVWGISSGKGGVGKSSVTVNLAAALSARGFKVGVLDADVYGHSIPRLFGIEGQRPTAIDQTFIPIEVHGIKVVSIEMFKPDRADPVAYRGPLLHRVLEQLLSDAYWGDLDFLLLDLPPGTGDIAISLGQLIPASEIIVVTTPQLAAAEVAERAGRIAHQLKQHIIGVIENMAAYTDPNTGAKVALFGAGGGIETSRRLSTLVGAEVPLVTSIPFDIDLREGGDHGAPIVLAKPESPTAQAFFSVVDQLAPRKKSLLGVRLGVST